MGQLVVQHIYFIILGVGTYAFVVEERQIKLIKDDKKLSKTEKSAKIQEVKNQRQFDINERYESKVILKSL